MSFLNFFLKKKLFFRCLFSAHQCQALVLLVFDVNDTTNSCEVFCIYRTYFSKHNVCVHFVDSSSEMFNRLHNLLDT